MEAQNLGSAGAPTGLMDLADRRRALAEWNRTASEYPRHACVHELIAEQAQRTPNSTAVVYGERTLTYRELDTLSNQLAHLLREKGVTKETLVGLCAERSLEMVVALLGILKAGGAYVPLDPAYPPDRIEYVLHDARVKVLITQQELASQLRAGAAEVVLLDRDWSALRGLSTEPVTSQASSRNLAYVIYTSGSTGRPKGVALEHRSVVNFLYSMQKEPGLSASDVLVAVTTLSFDIAGLEMYLPLITGAKLVVAGRDITVDGRKLADLLQASNATVMQATPATWRLLIESGWNGNSSLRVFCGGEALSPELARELVKRAASVWNLYGPTETTIWSTVYRVTGGEQRSIPIGHPIANTSLYVLDSDREPTPVGEEGELYIGGEGLARGYFERPELTADKFVHDPFSELPDARMYRTGDLARYRPDGTVDFLGRIDHQVKIRGFRIELGEIEAVLEQHPGIKQAIVVAREDRPGDKFLAAYLGAAGESIPERSELRNHLKQTLPDYMLPSAFVQLEQFPLTPNGKVDRKALPAPEASDFDAGVAYIAPRDAVEKKLVLMWEEVLNIRPIGVQTSFFDLGGRSILAARLFMQISREFGRDVPLATLFGAPTIEQLAQQLRGRDATIRYQTLIPIHTSGNQQPFFCVHGGEGGTLFLHRLSRAMGPDQPFYGFEPEGMDGGRFTRKTVQELAAHNIAEMRKIQPRGPHRIGGYCFGGLVAFEMAHQLRDQGEPAEVVVLFSAPLRFNRPKAAVAPIFEPETDAEITPAPASGSRLQRAVGWRWRGAKRSLRHNWEKTVCTTLLASGLKVPQSMRTMYVVRALAEAERAYVPQPYAGTITIFRGAGLYDADPDMGWGPLAASIDNFAIGNGANQASRRDIMNEPLVNQVAAKLRECMAHASHASAPAGVAATNAEFANTRSSRRG